MSVSKGDFKGDFLGFTFDGIHSSKLGIVRVSDGTRYNENLLPTIQDKTIQRPGADGMYYYGSFYTQRQINVSIAFDSLTENQLRHLKVLFGDKKVHTLIFDELPYKIYKVKPTGTPNLKYVAFDKPLEDYEREMLETESNNYGTLYGLNVAPSPGRIYKGEGQLTFVSYNPFARSRFKYLDEYNFENIPEWYAYSTESGQSIFFNNLKDWQDSGRLVKSNYSIEIEGQNYQIDTPNKSGVLCYNAGDLNTPFRLNLFLPSRGIGNGLTLTRLDLTNSPDYMQLMINTVLDYQDEKIMKNEAKKKILSYENKRDAKIKSYYDDFGVITHGEKYGVEPTNGTFTAAFEDGTLDTSSWTRVNVSEKGWSVIGSYENAPSLSLNPFTLHEHDSGICINTRLHLIEGIDEKGRPTGIIYNEYIESGDFFELEASKVYNDFALVKFSWAANGGTTGTAPMGVNGQIIYDYLYY